MNNKSKANIDEKIEYHFDQLFGLLGEDPDKCMSLLKNKVRKHVDIFNFFEDDTDLNNKKEIYANIAEFIGGFFKKPKHLLFNVTYRLCHEKDEMIVNENRLTKRENAEVSETLSKVEDLIASIKVIYELPYKSSTEETVRTTEIWHIKNGKSVNTSYQVRMNWEDLPGEIREEYIRTNQREITFKLYPKE